MRRFFKAVVAAAVSATVMVSALPAVNAAKLSEPIHVGETALSGLNTTFATDEHVDTKGISDGLTVVSYTPTGNYPYVVQFDMTIDTPLFAGSTDKGIRNAFGIGLATSSKSGEGGYFQVTSATDTTSGIIWKTANTATLGTLKNNNPYRILFTVESSGVTFTAIDLTTGTQAISMSGLGLRNATTANANVITVSTNARTEGETDSVTIENAVIYDVGPDEITASVEGTDLKTSSNTIDYFPFKTSYKVDSHLGSNGVVDDDYRTRVSLVDVEDHTLAYESDVISYNSETSSIVVDGDAIETGEYSFGLMVAASSAPDSNVVFPVTIVAGDVDTDSVMASAKETLGKLLYAAGDNEELAKDENGNYIVDNDLLFLTGSSKLPISWTCEQSTDGTTWEPSNEITSTGKLMRTDFDGQVRLVADYSYNDASDTVVIPVTLMDVEESYVAPQIPELTVTSLDTQDETGVTKLAEMTSLDYDVTLPTSIDVEVGDMAIEWAASTDNVRINKDTATIHTSDLAEHEVTLTATFVYSRDGKELMRTNHDYTVTVGMTEEDKVSEDTALDKYKVRFDSEYEEQFEDIPSSTSSDIELPTEGMFGSAIKWTSNAPTIISNSGEFTRPSSTRTVKLTASIMSGAASDTKNFTVTAQGKSSSGGGGGGGGGSTSSVGTSSNVTNSGVVASGNTNPVSVPQTGQQVIDTLITQREEAENAFTDLGSVSWARDAINGLAAAGIINGKTSELFAPNDNVTRAEFAKILMGVFGLNTMTYSTSSFNDVSTDAWYFQSVESAYNLGIIQGVADGYFDPNANITRQDMAVMVMRAATVSGKAISSGTAITFADDASIADYAKEAVSTLQAGGIISGVSATEFAPLSNATRAQAAKILYSFL